MPCALGKYRHRVITKPQSPSILTRIVARGCEVSASELLRWQWDGYARYHRSRVNLFIHIIAVPVFLLATVGMVTALPQQSLWPGIVSIAAAMVSVALQGRGHKRERVPPEPFTGPANAISRIFVEQWVTFPRFVLSGGWVRALREATRA